MNDCDQQELIELAHIPLRPARAGTPGEGIYLQLWVDYLALDPDRLHSILWSTGRHVGQREASVCASFMTFMGCNCGACFTDTAEQMLNMDARTSAARSAESRFQMAWALENRRSRGVNSGLRTIEAMLAKSPTHVSNNFTSSVDWASIEDITTADYDTVECMVSWWSGRDAHEMRAIAKLMIRAAEKKLWSGIFAPKDAPCET